MTTNQITRKAITFLKEQQAKDGSFLSFTSSDASNFSASQKYHSTFITTLILSSLNEVKTTPELDVIKQKMVSFLLLQKSKDWSFNYWVRNSSEYKTMPYPDDLDVTFCALSAIFKYNPRLINGRVMAKAVELLTLLEEKEGGPYRTWLVASSAPKVWRDIDPAVNSNISFFLSLVDVELPNLTKFIGSKIKNNAIASPYYPNIYSILYFVARAYGKNLQSKKIEKTLLSKMNKDGYWENPLYTSLAISTLLRVGTSPLHLKRAVNYLINHEKDWQEAYAFCIDPAKGKNVYYSGAPSLTTAFCLEALATYEQLNTHLEGAKRNNKDKKLQIVQEKVIKKVQMRFGNLPVPAKTYALDSISEIPKMDTKNQITYLPYVFYHVLKVKNKVVSANTLVSLGMANTYGWIAYTIYDNFLDEEGDPKSLPIANIALRELSRIYLNVLPDNSAFQKLFSTIMDELDSSNIWEVTNCRISVANGKIDLREKKLPDFGNYEVLYQRSLGHALGPIAVLFLLGYDQKSSEVTSLLSFFKHYLIARQLNDDVHDWEKDLRAGQISPVVAMLLKRLVLRNKKNTHPTLSLASIVKIQEIFWYEVVMEACDLIDKEVKKARRHLKKLANTFDNSAFEELLAPLSVASRLAREERGSTIEFISTYKNKTLLKT